MKHLLAQRLFDNAVQFSLYPMRCFPRHAHSWSDVAMFTFSAQEATACAFTSRAQKMPLGMRRLGACALERGDVNCYVRVNIFCAGGWCSCILKPRAENVSNHAQHWHADTCTWCTRLWSTCVCSGSAEITKFMCSPTSLPARMVPRKLLVRLQLRCAHFLACV